MNLRCQFWNKLASEGKLPQPKKLATNFNLYDLEPEINKILAGEQRGRVVVNLQ